MEGYSWSSAMVDGGDGRPVDSFGKAEASGGRQPIDAKWLFAAKRAIGALPLGTRGTSWFFFRHAEKEAGSSPYALPNNVIHSCVVDGILSKTGRIALHKYRRPDGKAVSHGGPEYVRGEPNEPAVSVQVPAPAPLPVPTFPAEKLESKLESINQQLASIRVLLERHFK